jgi:uncharacterized protein
MKVEELLKANKTHIRQAFFVVEIGVFGSLIKGTESSESDVDILVDFEKGHKDFFNYMRLKNFLEQLLGREVDLVIKNAVKKRLQERIFGEVVYV